MAEQQIDPLNGRNFIVEINGITQAGFSEVSGLGSSIQIIEYREGNDKTQSNQKLPGRVDYPNIVLKWGVTNNDELLKWHLELIKGDIKRKNMRIVLMDASGTPRKAWKIREAWPAKWTGPVLNAESNDVAIETLEIAHEGIELDDVSMGKQVVGEK
jgi:phage tail-like protein